MCDSIHRLIDGCFQLARVNEFKYQIYIRDYMRHSNVDY